MAHLYSTFGKMAHGVQKVGHPWIRIFGPHQHFLFRKA